MLSYLLFDYLIMFGLDLGKNLNMDFE